MSENPNMQETVPAALAGERIDRVVSVLTGLPRSTVSELIEKGHVTINGRPAKKSSIKVDEGQRIDVIMPDGVSLAPEPDEKISFEVVHVDDDVIVVNKPAGLVVHPGSGHTDDTLVNGLVARFTDMAVSLPGDPTRPGIVHRLDVGTSGLMVVARTPRSYNALLEMMKTRAVERRYLTLVWGDVQPDHGVIDAPIGRSDRDRKKMAVAPGGRHARTHYEVTRRSTEPDVSLVDVKLETGRTHQIRVHFAAIGHAVVGDARYRGVRAGIEVHRPFLHARYLDFAHPFTGEQMHFEAPIPDDLAALISQLFD